MEAASYARFAEAAVRVAKNRSVTPAPVGAVAYCSRSSGFSGNRSRFQSAPPDRGRSLSGQFRGGSFNFRKPSDGFYRTRNLNKEPQQQRSESHDQKDRPSGRIECYNCHKLENIARECRGPRRSARLSAPGFWRRPEAQQVNSVGSQSANWRSREAVPKEEAQQAEASSYTGNCINCIPKCKMKFTTSAFHSSRQLLWVSGKLNNAKFEKLLVDSGSPVTIMRRDLSNEVSGDNELLHTEEEDFQGVTEHGFEVLGRTHMRLRFGKLDVEHPVVVVDNIAHKFIIDNDFLLLHKCDILYLQDAILFGGKLVPLKLF